VVRHDGGKPRVIFDRGMRSLPTYADLGPDPEPLGVRADLLVMRRDMRAVTEGMDDSTENILWWPPAKVAGKHLAPYVGLQDELDPRSTDGEPAGPRVPAAR
jgi:hypothetical protein